ncbi:hypothetical protein P308_06350 [Pseudomonas piscis]|nr:hypothetical protein P308_06350 [Pseudomonas piscis]
MRSIPWKNKNAADGKSGRTRQAPATWKGNAGQLGNLQERGLPAMDARALGSSTGFNAPREQSSVDRLLLQGITALD